MKIFVNVARLEIGQLFTQGTRHGHQCTLDMFLVFIYFICCLCGLIRELFQNIVTSSISESSKQKEHYLSPKLAY